MAGQEARQRKSKGPGQERGRSSPVVYDGDADYKDRDSHSCTWTILKIFLLVFFLFFLIVLLLPSPIDSVAISYPDPPAFEGVLEPNDILTKAQRLYEGEIIGPESIVIQGDHVYTATADGKILNIYKGEIQVVAKLGKEPCGRWEDEPTCGRPLGMRFDHDGYLIVCDAYLGLHRINVVTGDVHVLWPSSAPIDGKLAKLFNSVAVTTDGMIYFTHSSTRWDRRDFMKIVLEGETTGRLIQYDPNTNTTTVLASGLAFPNGLEISRAEDFLIMAETTKARIWRYYLKGPNKGKMEVIAENLPGYPDNIQRSSTGGFWVGLASVRIKGKFSILQFSAPYPWLRNILAKVPNNIVEMILPVYGIAIEMDQSGNIIRSLHDPTGKTISNACVVADRDGVLYIGSFHAPFMGKLYLKQFSKQT